MISISNRDFECMAQVIEDMGMGRDDSTRAYNKKRLAKIAVRKLRAKIEKVKVKQR